MTPAGVRAAEKEGPRSNSPSSAARTELDLWMTLASTPYWASSPSSVGESLFWIGFGGFVNLSDEIESLDIDKSGFAK